MKDPLDFIDGDDPDTVDITDATFGAQAIYGSLSTIDLAKTTPEIFWSIFGTPNRKAGTKKWLDSSIRKLTEIAQVMPK